MPDLLNLFFYEAIEADIHENEFDKLISVKYKFPPRCCPACQSLDFVKHGTREPIFADCQKN